MSVIVVEAQNEQPEPAFGVVTRNARHAEYEHCDARDRPYSEKRATNEQIRAVENEKHERANRTPKQRGMSSWRHDLVATASISTAIPSGNAPAWTADRAGGSEPKCSA